MATPVYKWRQAIDGGGFQNAFAIADNDIHSSHQNVAVSGADVAGFHRTTNRNTNVVWKTSYRGIDNMNQNCVTAMEFARRSSGDGKLFVLTGRGGGDGFFISPDAGVTWNKGGLSIAGDGSTRGMNGAREVGRHICSDLNGSHLWVAGKHSYDGAVRWGIAHSSNDGSSFSGGTGFAMGTGKIPTDSTVRFIAQHPVNDDVLYVGVDGKRTSSGKWSVADNAGGLYKITNAKTNSPSVQKLIGPTTGTQADMNWVRDGIIIKEGANYMLYFIAGKKTGTGDVGTFSNVTLFKLNLASGGVLTDLNLGSKGLDTDQQWTTLDGYRNAADTATTIWMGGWQGASHELTGVVVSRNGGSTWNNLIGTNYPTISKNFPGGREWWMFSAHESFQFNKSNYDCAHIRVDPNNTNRVFSAGRGGIWMTTDDGATWRPAMEGLGVSMAQASSYNPSNKNQFAEGNVDWAAVLSSDKFKYTSMPKGKDPGPDGAANTVYAFHWTSRTLAMATGGRGSSGDASNGIVATSVNPFTTGSTTAGITDQNWQSGVAKANRPQVVGIMDGVDSAGKHTLVAIAQKNPSRPNDDTASSGIWRKVITAEPATGSWSRVSSAAFSKVMTKNSMNVTSYWAEGSNTLYTFDRVEGKLWRSNNWGSTWSDVWTYSGTKNVQWAGFIAGASESLVYVSVAGHVYKFASANSGSSLTPTNVTPSGLDAPGAIAVDDDGWVYVTRRFKTGVANSNKLYRSKNAGADWETISTIDYEQGVVFPHNMSVMTQAGAKTILVDTWGNGTFIGEAGASDPTPTYVKFSEDFENDGTPPAAGTAITASNSNFGAVSGSVTFSATSEQEDRSGQFSIGSTAGAAYGESEALEPKPQYALDFYFQVTDLPSTTTRIVTLLNDAGTGFTGLQLTAAGKLVLQDGVTGVYTSTMTLAVGQWYRVAVMWNSTGDTAQLKIWSGANLLARYPTEDSGAKAYTNTTNTSKVRVGLLNATLTNTAVLFDDIMTKDDATWPDRGFVDPSHAIILGFMPMGIS